MKKVLLITHIEPVIHGQAMMAKQLVDLSKEWEDVELLTLNTVYTDDRGKLSGFSFGKTKRLFSYMFQARKMVKKQKIEQVLMTPAFFRTPFVKDGLFILFLSWFTKAKLTAWVHMDPNRLDYEKRGWLFRKFARKVAGKFERWVACAPELLKRWPKWLSENYTTTHVYNGIPIPDSVDRSSREGAVRVLYLSAMDVEKGWEETLAVAQEICGEHDNVIFDFYGGAGKQHSEEEIREEFDNINHPRIQWHGAVYDEPKQEALNSADLFVFPSYTEQFPISVLEAMAAGLPVVATDVGAIKDALPSDELIQPKNKKALKEATLKLIQDKELRLSMGERNRDTFIKQFSDQAFATAWKTLFTNH